VSDMRILVLGASGMLGNAVLRFFSQSPGFDAYGTVRSLQSARLLPAALHEKLIVGVDVESADSVMRALQQVKPQIVVNCVGLIKQLSSSAEPLFAIPVNALMPHRVAQLCALADARFVHLSTDCVFSGSRGAYVESDPADAQDLYGRSKCLGEVDYDNALTLRTSIIGHELGGSNSLVGWFLSQEGQVNGYDKAVFSGMPTVEIARVIRDYVIPHPELRGLYHLSVDPIDKYSLLKLVAEVYGKEITIVRNSDLVIDRSLDSTRFREATGFRPPPWHELVRRMHEFK
jgi:dTDP-4-dehydrorhamnose reductase